jgi:hypothetical protein
MSKKRLLRALAVVLPACLVLSAAQARADIYIKQKMHTDAFQLKGQSQPAKDVLMTAWLAAGKLRTDTEGASSTILRSDKKTIYMIDHIKKQYAEMSVDFDQLSPRATKDMAARFAAKVTETSEIKIVKGRHCRRYLVELTMPAGSYRAELWAAEDFKIDYAKFFAALNPMLTDMPGYEPIFLELKKIKGVPVYQTGKLKTAVAEVGQTSELLEYEEKDAPAGTFEIPAGYEKVESIGANGVAPSR